MSIKVVRTLVFAAVSQGIFAISAFGSLLCTPGTGGETIIPVTNGQTTYCVSDFGWSDAWFPGTPTTYDASLELLGDDALNLAYSGGGTGLGGPGVGWLSPSLDAGTQVPQPRPSKWSVITSVHSTGPSSAESVIGDVDGLQITLDTTLIGPGVQISLAITNNSLSNLTGFELTDYFNFHPNGSFFPSNTLGTTSIQNGCVVTTGPATGTAGESFVENGFMCGIRAPDNFDLGPAANTTANTGSVWRDVENSVFNNLFGPLGPGDNAGALEWNLGDLAPGQTVYFAVGKNMDPSLQTPPGIPEPASIWLTAGALVLLARWRRWGVR